MDETSFRWQLLLTDLICKYTKLDRKLYSLSFEGRNAVEESVTLHIENHDELLCTHPNVTPAVQQ